MPSAPAATPDPAAFRRLQSQLERPAAVFAELCWQDAAAGDQAVAAAMRAQSVPARLDPHALSVRFWRDLLATPDRVPFGPAPWAAPLDGLQRLPRGLRLLALLRWLSGLGEVELGAILGRPPAAIRRALAEAEALAGPADWAAWQSAVLARMDALPPARLVNIASWRSLRSQGPEWVDAPTHAPRRRALAVVALGTLLALAATWWLPAPRGGDDAPKVRTRTLSEAAPAARFDTETAIASHPDRALLSMSEADAAIARDTAFYAWYQAERLGTSTYEPPAPTDEAPEHSSTREENGGADAP